MVDADFARARRANGSDKQPIHLDEFILLAANNKVKVARALLIRCLDEQVRFPSLSRTPDLSKPRRRVELNRVCLLDSPSRSTRRIPPMDNANATVERVGFCSEPLRPHSVPM